MIRSLQSLIRSADAAIARLYLSHCAERDSLMGFLFHSLFRGESEIGKNHIDPLQRTTVDQFRQFVEYYLHIGYRFVDLDDIARGLPAGGKYAVITFDDGYYNNTRALPILQEYDVPAIFFICSDNVRENRCFWWDVLYRELIDRGVPRQTIYRDGLAQKTLTTGEIESRLAGRFGSRAFAPRGDIDRPFSPSELRDFAQSRHVRIGNHTAGHAILTNYPPEQVRSQVQSAQQALREMTGASPIAIAYPNGGYNPAIAMICRDLGLSIGFTTQQRKNPLPAQPQAAGQMALGRFCLHGSSPILTQCRTCRSDLQLYPLMRDGYVSLRRRRHSSPTARQDAAVVASV